MMDKTRYETPHNINLIAKVGAIEWGSCHIMPQIVTICCCNIHISSALRGSGLKPLTSKMIPVLFDPKPNSAPFEQHQKTQEMRFTVQGQDLVSWFFSRYLVFFSHFFPCKIMGNPLHLISDPSRNGFLNLSPVNQPNHHWWVLRTNHEPPALLGF